jgi:hypothetical protein
MTMKKQRLTKPIANESTKMKMTKTMMVKMNLTTVKMFDFAVGLSLPVSLPKSSISIYLSISISNSKTK